MSFDESFYSSGPAAIETLFKGYRFRSLLEARWAVFFDSLGIPWEYEAQGFDLAGKWYLPDFWLPEQKLFVEIKPNPGDLDTWPEHPFFDWLEGRVNPPTENAETFPRLGFDFVLIQGNPWLEAGSTYREICKQGHQHILSDADSFEYNGFVFGDCYHRWTECACCRKIGITFDGRSARLCGCFDGDKSYNPASPRLRGSFERARAFRPGLAR